MNNSQLPLALNFSGPDVGELQRELAELGFTIPVTETQPTANPDVPVFGAGTRAAVAQLQLTAGLSPTGVFDVATNLALTMRLGTDKNPNNVIEGRIFTERGNPAKGLRLRLVRRVFGGTIEPISEGDSESLVTDENGYYRIEYPASASSNIELQLVQGAPHAVKVTSLTTTKFGAAKFEVVNVVASADVVPLPGSEYDRLSDALKPLVGGEIALLRTAEEVRPTVVGEKVQQDITFLHQETKWDARLIALNASVQKLSAASRTADPDAELDAKFLYGLARVGLPTGEQELALIKSVAIGQAIDLALRKNIIAFDSEEVRVAETTAFLNAFETFSKQQRMQRKAVGLLASPHDVMVAADLNEDQITILTDLLIDPTIAGDDLWKKAEEKGLDAKRLQIQGKLAYLTLNNTTMTNELQTQFQSPDDMSRLVDMDFYKQETWENQIGEVTAANVDQLIPSIYMAADPEARMKAYARDLARKVRLSYPTAVVGRMLQTGEIAMQGISQSTGEFFKVSDRLGYRIGQETIEAFAERAQVELEAARFSADTIEGLKLEIKAVQRLAQISPSVESLQTLAELGFSSSSEVVAIPYEDFVLRYFERPAQQDSVRFPSREEIDLVYRKAEQVDSIVRSFFPVVQQAATSSVVGGAIPVTPTYLEVKRSLLVKKLPNLEQLFGSLDFCECEHCRSVLSPAAYLVDLLRFLEPDLKTWEESIKEWADTHGGVEYPFENDGQFQEFKAAWLAEHGGDPQRKDYQKKPYDVLVQDHRPDIPFIQLSCENTSTALPYIDIVNEIQEYYVARGTLEGAARNTAGATTPELLAEPQVGDRDVYTKAYDELREAKYPMTLPFNLWLSTVRSMFAHFETSLGEAMELFRLNDVLFADQDDPNSPPYDRFEIFRERLGLIPETVDLLIDDDLDFATNWHTLYGYPTPEAAWDELHPPPRDAPPEDPRMPTAKLLARRLGVSYQELTDLLTTWFLNPDLDRLVLLRRLGLDVEDVVRYKTEDAMTKVEQNAFEDRLTELNTRLSLAEGSVAELIDEQWTTATFDEIFVLKTPPNCTFDDTHIRLANPNSTVTEERFTELLGHLLFKMNLFVRLWRGLGWSMTETDEALRVFLPGSGEPPAVEELPAAMKTALVYMSHLETLASRARGGASRRLSLLTVWSDLTTTGKQPLYAKLFLNRNMLSYDGVFDHSLGNYLTETDVKIRDYLPALREALNLTAAEIGQIVTDDEQRLEEVNGAGSAPLTLANVSLLYRYASFARSFGLSVPELIALKALSGKNPFQPLLHEPDDEATTVSITLMDEDFPFEQTIGFVDVVDTVKASGFSVEDLDYLFRHEFDPNGVYQADSGAILGLVKTLAGGLRQIETAHALPADTAAFVEINDEFVRQELSTLLPIEVVDSFMRMWTGADEYHAEMTGVDAADRLGPVSFTAIPSIQVTHEGMTQGLTYRGVLTESEKLEILASMSDLPPEDQPTAAALDNLEFLLDAVMKQAQDRFAYFDKNLGFVFSTGTMNAAEVYEILFTEDGILCSPLDTECERRKQETLARKRELLLRAIVSAVRAALSRRLISETVAATLGSDPALTATLLESTDLLAEPGTVDEPIPLLAVLEGAKERGVTAHQSAEAGSVTDWEAVGVVLAVDTSFLPESADTNHARFEGYFEVPARGDYEFVAAVGRSEANVELWLADQIEPLIKGAAGELEIRKVVSDLRPGIPYRFTFTATNLAGTGARLLIGGGAVPEDNLGQLPLLPVEPVARIERSWTLLKKALQVITGLELGERELKFFRANTTAFADFDLKTLPVETSEDDTGAAARFAWFLRLADYVALRSTMAGDSEGLIDVFERARRSAASFVDAATTLDAVEGAMLEDLSARIADLTRREPTDVLAAMAALRLKAQGPDDDTYFEIAGLHTEEGVGRLWEVLEVVERFGVPVKALASEDEDGNWVGWVQARPDDVVTANLRRTVKARYSPETWQRIAPSIFDPLRRRQRDALVAYLMANLGFDHMEQLYEFFLVDPGMEPVVQTSRIRMAIASVQLFIQRCLLNLERYVQPSAINAQHWQWMKRYRVWEANRKIFLYPENWLEPEFRDDKTHLFQELEGTLLAGDVTDELAEDAFFTYLKKLEEIAHLEIVTFFADEQADDSQNVLHVIGRTATEPRKYFYRRFKHGAWTPWEPVTAEIEGDHVVAVMWRSRLHLFWVTFTLKPNTTPGGVGNSPRVASTTSVAGLTLDQVSEQVAKSAKSKLDIRLNWSDLYQGEWSVREAGVQANGDLTDPDVTPSFNAKDVSIHVSKGEPTILSDGTLAEGPVVIHLKSNDGTTAVNLQFRVASRHVPPRRIKGQAGEAPVPPFQLTSKSTVRYSGSGAFNAWFDEEIETPEGGAMENIPSPKKIFERGAGSGFFTVVGPSHQLKDLDPIVGPLVSPFFYSDDQVQLFGLPVVKEESIREWTGYVPVPEIPDFTWDKEDYWAVLETFVHEQIPRPDPGPYDIDWPEEFDSNSILETYSRQDLFVNDSMVFRFGDALVSSGGGFHVLEVEEGALVGMPAGGATLSGMTLVTNESRGFNLSMETGPAINVVGAGGANYIAATENGRSASGFNSVNIVLFNE